MNSSTPLAELPQSIEPILENRVVIGFAKTIDAKCNRNKIGYRSLPLHVRLSFARISYERMNREDRFTYFGDHLVDEQEALLDRCRQSTPLTPEDLQGIGERVMEAFANSVEPLYNDVLFS